MNPSIRRLLVVTVAVAATALFVSRIAHAAKPERVNRTYQVGDACRIRTNDKKRASLADLQAGQKVVIRYQEREDARVATLILEVKPRPDKPPKPRSPGEGPAQKMVQPRDPSLPPPDPRTRGVITAIDLESQTVTITERQRAKPKK
ncbi:hypothetical protein HQ590_08655 [bacterium]|nr:hypothetical protein [bacterium]